MTTGPVSANDVRTSFDYVNHAGVDKRYTVKILNMTFCSVKPWYPTPTWLVRAFVPAINDYRYFQLAKMRNIEEIVL